jgi:exosortase/archaeosortase family protein
MRLLKKLSGSRTTVVLTIISVLLLVYFIVPGFFFKSESEIPVLSSLINSYRLLIEMFSSFILNLAGSTTVIENHMVYLSDGVVGNFTPELYFKKWIILFIILVWITKTNWMEKVLFTAILLITHFLVNSIYLASGAILASQENKDFTLLTIPLTFGILCLYTIIYIWYRKYKGMLIPRISKLKINTRLFQNNFRFAIVGYTFILLYYFLYDIFDYQLWINFLFTTSKQILGVLGYSATVEPFYLIGDNGSIFMLKSCLGYQTLLLFALFIILTGNTSNKIRWIYLISGLLLLNLANILRFVFLFIYIQKHGAYELAMDVHDMYNYIIYGIVFILWIIWFEKFADREKRKKQDKR